MTSVTSLCTTLSLSITSCSRISNPAVIPRSRSLSTQTILRIPSIPTSDRHSRPSAYDKRFRSASFQTANSLPSTATQSVRPPPLRESSLRPPVRAAARLTSWSSTFSQTTKQDIRRSIPAALADRADQIALLGLAVSTLSSYGSGVLRFTQFCDEWGISEDDRMPASAHLLSAFAATYAGSYRGKTIGLWLSSIRMWHTVNHAPWHGDDERLHLVRKAADKLGNKFKRPVRPPVSLDHLRTLYSHLNLSDPFHAAVWATATVSFFGCRRLGETTVPSPNTCDPSSHCTRSTTIRFSLHSTGSSSASFHIPWTKTTRSEGATVVVTARDDFLCPVRALRNHLDVNSSPPDNTPVFGYRTASGSWSHMDKPSFLTFVGSVWDSNPSAGHISGHSFRIGGAVALLLSGVPPEVVAATGGWTSLAFLLYWRRIEEIIPLSTSLAYTRSQVQSVSAAISRFACTSGSST